MIDLIIEEAASDHHLSLSRMCAVLELSRADYYRHRTRLQDPDDDLELREQIQRIAVEMSAYGYRRITAELLSFAQNNRHLL
jgi:hypothetical protein